MTKAVASGLWVWHPLNGLLLSLGVFAMRAVSAFSGGWFSGERDLRRGLSLSWKFLSVTGLRSCPGGAVESLSGRWDRHVSCQQLV